MSRFAEGAIPNPDAPQLAPNHTAEWAVIIGFALSVSIIALVTYVYVDATKKAALKKVAPPSPDQKPSAKTFRM